MARRIGAKRRDRIVEDILHAQHDVVALARAHRLSPIDLAHWVSDTTNHQMLRGLCVMADVQTQIMLSRYRLLAASRLIKLATEEGPEGGSDVARKACVDLLRLDLKGADLPDVQAGGEPEDAAVTPSEAQQLRQMLYGAESDAAIDRSARRQLTR